MTRNATLYTKNLIHNISVIKNKAPNSKIIAMVKANAYGHGIRSVSARIKDHVDMLGVASIDEALSILKIGIKTPILLAEGVMCKEDMKIAIENDFHIVFHQREHIEWINDIDFSKKINAWIKIDTGMGRIGFNIDDGDRYYKILNESEKINKPIRIMSHFACADNSLHPLNSSQIRKMTDFIKGKSDYAEISFCNSASIFQFNDYCSNYIRPGISIYGCSPINGKTAKELGLIPVMQLESNIIAVKQIKQGDSIGYGARYKCDKDMIIGIIGFGYGDGYPVSAKDGTPVIINGNRTHIVGKVSMDMISIDLTNINNVNIGDKVILWGKDLPVEEISDFSGVMNYSLITGVQNRVKFHWED